MNKRDMVAKMARDSGITGLQAEKAFHSLLQGVIDSLKKEKRVTFSGFGSFEIRHRRARVGRNPKTGETIDIPPKRRIKFNPSQIFKDQL